MPHPVIRICTFLVFAVLLSMASPAGLLYGGGGLTILYSLVDPTHFRSAWRLVLRLRWFYLSIVILYFWSTPGQPLSLPLLGWATHWLPTRQGVASALERISVLVFMIMAANLLLRTTSQTELIAAIHWLARPLKVLGLSQERLAVRIVLVMDCLSMVQEIVREMLAEMRGMLRSWRQIGQFSSAVFLQVASRAEGDRCRTIQLAPACAPPAYQWLYPLFLVGVFYLMH